jgi:hypothetical protein
VPQLATMVTSDFTQVPSEISFLLSLSLCNKRTILFISSISLLSTTLRSFLDLLLSEIVPQSAPISNILTTPHLLHEDFTFLGEAFQGYPHQIRIRYDLPNYIQLIFHLSYPGKIIRHTLPLTHLSVMQFIFQGHLLVFIFLLVQVFQCILYLFGYILLIQLVWDKVVLYLIQNKPLIFGLLTSCKSKAIGSVVGTTNMVLTKLQIFSL